MNERPTPKSVWGGPSVREWVAPVCSDLRSFGELKGVLNILTRRDQSLPDLWRLPAK